MLETIYRCGYEILNEYYGAAALVWYDPAKPSEVFFYHGRSMSYHATNHYKSNAVQEERPLFFYAVDNETFYYSSIKESLEVINDNQGTIKGFGHNTVYKVTDGDVMNAEIVFEAKRDEEMSQLAPPTKYDHSNVRSGQSRQQRKAANLLISNEMMPIKAPANASKFIFRRLRVYRNGHLVNGIFYDVKGFGLVLLTTNTLEDAKIMMNKAISENQVLDIETHTLITREMASKKHGKFIEVPFGTRPYDVKSDAIDLNIWMVQEGVALKTALDYRRCKSLALTDRFTGKAISEMSRFPYVFLPKDNNRSSTNTELIYKDGNICTFKLKNPFCAKTYTFRNGRLAETDFNINNNNDKSKTLTTITQTAEKAFKEKNSNQIKLNLELDKINDVESLERELQLSLVEPYEVLTDAVKTLTAEIANVEGDKTVLNTDLKGGIIDLLQEASESIAAVFAEIEAVKGTESNK